MIRLTRKRPIVTAVALFIIGSGLWITWTVCDWPPVRLIMKYGFPPAGGPTGQRMTVGGIEFIELSPGYFQMGSHYHCDQGDLVGRICSWLGLPWGVHPQHKGYLGTPECPLRWVEIESPFWIARTEVSFHQFREFSATSHARSETDLPNQPVTSINHYLAGRFCEWLSQKVEGSVRLPFESEWEYACQAGSSSSLSSGDGGKWVAEQAWHRGTTLHPMPVATKKPNAWSLYDMLGNVWEWCHEERGFDPSLERDGVPHSAAIRGGDWIDSID